MREALASIRSLLSGGAAFIVGNSLLGIALPLRMEERTVQAKSYTEQVTLGLTEAAA